jgi:NAD(P)-dependent dehydrogenase (short-subunit alcohol dehydrogenase family)
VTVDLQGRTVIVTGGGGGIGGASAAQLAERGASIVLVDWDATAAKDILGRLPSGSHHFIEADVCNPDDVSGIFEWINGEGRDFAGLVNAAGIVSGGSPWPASDLPRMRTVIDVNAAGTVLLSTLAARQDGPGGRVVVNVASAAAIRAHPPDPAYATSKAGVLAFTRSAAAAAVPGLRVNAVLPGVVRTRMLDSTGTDGVAPWLAPRLEQRLLTAEQVATAIVELVVGDQNGEAWSLELDKSNPDVVVREVL